MSVNAILQARFSSTRLPGKVLKKIVNKPMLALQIERIKAAKLIDNIIIATSIEQNDDAIANLCEKTKVNIEIICPSSIKINSYPGAFSQIISNLIINFCWSV